MIEPTVRSAAPHRSTRRRLSTVAACAMAAGLALGPVMAVDAGALAAGPGVYEFSLSGAAESPPNPSPGTGSARVDIDLAAHTLRVRVSFSGLQGTTTAAHIHACTATPGIGTAGVAVQTPNLVGFPLGVTSGTYDHTFDTLVAATYAAGFLTASGGTPAGAEAALAACAAAGGAYLNIHTSSVPGGEIRGFLPPAPPPPPPLTSKDQCRGGGFAGFVDPRTGKPFTNQGQCVSFLERRPAL